MLPRRLRCSRCRGGRRTRQQRQWQCHDFICVPQNAVEPILDPKCRETLVRATVAVSLLCMRLRGTPQPHVSMLRPAEGPGELALSTLTSPLPPRALVSRHNHVQSSAAELSRKAQPTQPPPPCNVFPPAYKRMSARESHASRALFQKQA